MAGAQRFSAWPALAARQSGVSLIEVLVSMFIMALGMVGLAALQARTTSYQLGAGQRAQLSALVADYAERVRSNPAQAPGKVATSTYLKAGLWSDLSAASPPVAAVDCAARYCDPAQLADHDMAQWLGAVRRELPQGSVRVSGNVAQGLRLTFMWTDKDSHLSSRVTDPNQPGVIQNVVALATATQCSTQAAGAGQATCCPDELKAPAGVRCANFTVVP